MRFNAKVKNGEVIYKNKELFDKFLLQFEGKKINIDIKKFTNKRTITQNRFYWFYLKVISEETGHTSNELHEYFKRTHLPPRFIKVLNEELKIPATTTKLTTHQFTMYMEKICAQVNVPIPNPLSIN